MSGNAIVRYAGQPIGDGVATRNGIAAKNTAPNGEAWSLIGHGTGVGRPMTSKTGTLMPPALKWRWKVRIGSGSA